jgi:hypothetical protein
MVTLGITEEERKLVLRGLTLLHRMTNRGDVKQISELMTKLTPEEPQEPAHEP